MVGDRQEFGSDDARDLIEDSIRRGLAAYRLGDFSDAARALGEVLPRLENEMPELWERLGNAYFETRDFDRAIDVLERVVSSGHATAQTYVRLAACSAELERLDDAARYQEAAVGERPEDPALWRDLGVARRRAGLVREAVTCFQEALRLDPKDAAGVGIELGRALKELGERDRAIVAYREAVARQPEFSDLWSDLAVLYSEMGLFAESDQAVREAIRLKPNNAAAWHTIATNTLKRGNLDMAQRAYQRMKELNPDFADEILSWVANTAGLPPDDLATPALAAVPLEGKVRRGRILPFRSRA
jgi:tetratricopeptide (TPR) repeat protein